MSKKTRDLVDILSDLASPVLGANIKSKPGAGNEKFAYLESAYIFHRADETFGADNWSILSASVGLAMPPYPCGKRIKIQAGGYDTRGTRYERDTWIDAQGFGFAATANVTIEVRFPNGSVVTRANTGNDAGWYEDFGSKQPQEFRRVFGSATTHAIKRCFETLGVAFGRGMNKDGVVPAGYLIDDDTIQMNADSYGHLWQNSGRDHEQHAPDPAPAAQPAPVVAQVTSGRLTTSEPVNPEPVKQAAADGGIDMDLPIGGAMPAAAPAPAAVSALSKDERAHIGLVKAAMRAPGDFQSVEDWKSAFRTLRDLLDQTKSPQALDMVRKEFDDWKSKAEEYGAFKDARLQEPLGKCYSHFDTLLRSRLAILEATVGSKAA